MPVPVDPRADPGRFLTQMSDQLTRTVQQGQTMATGVMGSLQRAAAATGVDFGYLVKTAKRESSLNANAHAPTSSAAGLFQFIEQTWLGTLKANGAKHGYGGYADQIVRGRDGRYAVTDPGMRKQVLALRYNPDANAVMAAEMTAGHAAYLKGRIGRNATQGELYAAHFLGPDGAADLIRASVTRPTAQAASLFPAAARSNRNIFYMHGQALSVADVMANLTRTGGAEPLAIPDAVEDPQDVGNPLIMARLGKIRADEAMMKLVFGDGDQKGMLFTTQLMGAFGPNGDDEASSEATLSKAFGAEDGQLG